MARSWINEGVQIGPETTAGTSVAASKKLSSLEVNPSSSADISKYRASGFKFPSVQALNREWTEARLTGPITYTEIIYLLCSLLKNVTPTGESTVKTWTFDPSSTVADPVKTFTVERGSAARAEKFVYGLVNALTLRFNQQGATLDGTMLGKALQHGITLTTTPTLIPLVPVTRPQVTVKLADTQAGLTGASALTGAFSVDWSMTNRFSPIWALTGSVDWARHTEIEPQTSVRLLMEADATGMGLSTQMRAGTFKFMRIQAVGPNISGGDDYELRIDTALKVMDVSEFRDQEGVTAIEWSFEAFHDPTWTRATQITVINDITTL
jgi:hypothetical protein